MQVKDEVTVDRDVSHFEFVLNAGFELEVEGARLQTLQRSRDGLRVAYRATPEDERDSLVLRYRGAPKFAATRGMGDMPQGELNTGGVYLDARSAWYPLFDAVISGVDMEVSLPGAWQSISIGQRSAIGDRQRWTSNKPHDNLYLIAGPYERYVLEHDGIDLSVWLLNKDQALADRYLGVMGGYIDHYSQLIGPYPYRKFAVVENRYQTGFGMPSFTLLGSRVMRLPFIPFTSLPHEILHNWWGNGVWVDYAGGNWSEGLTAYLADHWMQERRGQGDQYRLKALQRYTNFAADGDDKPLREFVSRHGDASQSIGYSKSLMLFHMLRDELGDADFTAGLQRLWREQQFRDVGFEQTIRTLAADRPELAERATALLDSIGAPRLELGDVTVTESSTGFQLAFELNQSAQQQPLRVPLGIMVEGQTDAQLHHVLLDQPVQRFKIDLPARPLRLDVDPAYDLLRYLDVSEQPPALNRLFGGKTWLVLPRQAGDDETAAWEALAEQWQRRYPRLAKTWDDQAGAMPRDANLVILGWDNHLRAANNDALERNGQRLVDDGVRLKDQTFPASQHSLVLVNSDAAGRTVGLVHSPTPNGIRALARKLPHYGSYGRLVFDADASANQRKDTLTSVHSTLSRQLGDQPVAMRLPARTILGAN